MREMNGLLQATGTLWRSEEGVRVAFVNRNHSAVNRERGGEAAFYSRFPPLGLLNLAACLKADSALIRREVSIKLFEEEDFTSLGAFVAAVRAWLESFEGPTMICATTYTHAIEEMEKFLHEFDGERHLIVAGGAHATVQPSVENAHLVVRGEGRAPLRHIINTFGTPHFCMHADGNSIVSSASTLPRPGRPQYDDSLSTLPSPAFDYSLGAHHTHEYQTHIARSVCVRPQIYVSTQSCRARCTFCSTYLIHGSRKSRDVALVKADLKELVEVYGHDGFEFWDDDLLQHEQLPQLLSMLEELGKPWYCFGRTETINADISASLARAGCAKIFLGIESMSQERLDYFNKKTTVAQNVEATLSLHDAGVGVIAAFILGAPDDTFDSILDNYSRYFDLPIENLSTSILTPDPGTKEFSRARQRGGAFLEVLSGPAGRTITPSIERFGAAVPAGLPTVCEHVTKLELNIISRVINSHFLLRESQWMKLAARVPNALHAELARYFLFQESKSRFRLPRGIPDALKALHDETLERPPVSSYSGISDIFEREGVH